MADALILNALDIEALTPRLDLASALRRVFLALAEGGAVQPPQTLALLPVGGGDFITYAGAVAGAFAVKVSPYLPGPSGAVVTAWTLAMSVRTGEPLLLCDSKGLTRERTAATTALATDLLAPPHAAGLTIIGSGDVALAHLRHALSLRPWSRLKVWSPRAALEGRLARFLAVEPRIEPVASLEAACDGADVIMLCTSSPLPVVHPRHVQGAALVTSISTNAPDAHEVPPEWLPHAAVYCDYRATAPLSAGEMRLAAARGLWSPEAIKGDIPELLTGRAPRPAPGQCAFFRSIGLGLEDLAAALEVLRVLRPAAGDVWA